MKTPRVFLDTEFTGLVKDTELVSIGLYINQSNYFYAEFNDWDKSKSFEWLETTVISKLEFQFQDNELNKIGNCWRAKGNKQEVASELRNWLSQYEVIEIWADVLAYDWVLFCDLFGGAFGIPENIFYIPFDLATLFRIKGVIEPKGQYDGDISRYDYVGVDKTLQHHALADARVESMCYLKMMGI